MSTQEIPRDQWSAFLDTFSHQHQGWLSTLEVIGTDIGAQSEATDLPFEGISIAATPEESEAIAVSLGQTSGDHVTHMIVKPSHIWLEEAAEGANPALEIESTEDTKTILRLRQPLQLA